MTGSKKLLSAAQSREADLGEEIKKLKLEVRRLGKRGEELAEQSERLSQELLTTNIEQKRLSTELAQAKEDFAILDAIVILEHEEGFNKAMRQTAFLLKVNPIAAGFNIHQDVYRGEMRPVEANLTPDMEGTADGGNNGVNVERPGATDE